MATEHGAAIVGGAELVEKVQLSDVENKPSTTLITFPEKLDLLRLY